MGGVPQEVELWRVIPALRREFAKALAKQGLSRKQAAEKLGLTPAAISQYFNEKRAFKIRFPRSVLGRVEEASERLLRGESSFLEEVQRILLTEEVKRITCSIHKAENPELKECNVCFEKR